MASQHGDYRRIYAGPSPIQGTGIFAREPITAGEVVFVRDRTRMVDDEHPLRPELGEFEWHCDDIAGGQVVYLPEPERYSNHSCDPNSYDRTEDGVTRRYALRDIAEGEEITLDYSLNAPAGGGTMRCNSGEANSFAGLPRCRSSASSPTCCSWEPWFVAEHRDAIERLCAKKYAQWRRGK
ncbi:MAG: SET domain-containing protein-lysine N-methyltransferase [Dehalococcoidia bacterium]